MIAALRAFFQSILSWFRTPVEKPLTAEASYSLVFGHKYIPTALRQVPGVMREDTIRCAFRLGACGLPEAEAVSVATGLAFLVMQWGQGPLCFVSASSIVVEAVSRGELSLAASHALMEYIPQWGRARPMYYLFENSRRSALCTLLTWLGSNAPSSADKLPKPLR